MVKQVWMNIFLLVIEALIQSGRAVIGDRREWGFNIDDIGGQYHHC